MNFAVDQKLEKQLLFIRRYILHFAWLIQRDHQECAPPKHDD